MQSVHGHAHAYMHGDIAPHAEQQPDNSTTNQPPNNTGYMTTTKINSEQQPFASNLHVDEIFVELWLGLVWVGVGWVGLGWLLQWDSGTVAQVAPGLIDCHRACSFVVWCFELNCNC